MVKKVKIPNEVLDKLSISSGEKLPVKLQMESTLYDGMRWKYGALKSDVDSKGYEWGGAMKKLLEGRSVMHASKTKPILYQSRVLGPYITELWSYDVFEMRWTELKPPPMFSCLDMKVCSLPVEMLKDLKPVTFQSDTVPTGVFTNFEIIAPDYEEPKEFTEEEKKRTENRKKLDLMRKQRKMKALLDTSSDEEEDWSDSDDDDEYEDQRFRQEMQSMMSDPRWGQPYAFEPLARPIPNKGSESDDSDK